MQIPLGEFSMCHSPVQTSKRRELVENSKLNQIVYSKCPCKQACILSAGEGSCSEAIASLNS